MDEPGRPGPKPKRLYARVVRLPEGAEQPRPPPAALRRFARELDRIGRLVALGGLTAPRGDLVVIRARSMREALRVLRIDPFRGLGEGSYEVVEWNPRLFGSGVNLDPPPARGSGRLTALLRVGVVVRDLDKARNWYEEVLGVPVREYDAESGRLEMSLGRGASALALVAPRAEWGEPYYSEGMARIGQSTGVVFQTDSVPALELRLRNRGARITDPPREQPWGGVTLRFTDPDGNEFLAFQPSEHPPGPLARSLADRGERPRRRRGAAEAA